MWRLLGALIGSGLVVGAGILSLQHQTLENPLRPVHTPVTEEKRQPPPLIAAEPPASAPDVPVPRESANPKSSKELATSQPEPEWPVRQTAAPPPAALQQSQWHRLWGPFRSELSARGFADHLSRISGRDLQIQQEGPGRYMVGLAYSNDEDLSRALSLIAVASGLSTEGTNP